MPPSEPLEWSRRRFLASAAAGLAATAGLAACGTPADGVSGTPSPSAGPAGAGSTAAPPGGTAAAAIEQRLAQLGPQHQGPTALTGLRRPGDGAPVVVTVAGDRLAAVDERAEADVPSIDLGGLVPDGGWVVPGWIDAHVHLQFADPLAIAVGGVTTVRDLGGPPSAAQAIRDRIAPGRELVDAGGRGGVAPGIHIAGRILTAVGGYPSTSWGADGTAREVAGVEDAAAAVAEQVAAGAVVIKVALEGAGGQPVLDQTVLAAVVAAAREVGLRVTAHVGSAALLELALEAGVDELAHLPLHDVTPAEMVAVARAGVVLVPTLAIRGPDPDAAAAVAAFREAGGTVVYGSDLGNGGTSPGIMVEEVRALLATGMSPEEVLASATHVAADHLGLDTGRLEAGAAADLVVLGSDPFADPRAYDDVVLVMAGGMVVTPR